MNIISLKKHKITKDYSLGHNHQNNAFRALCRFLDEYRRPDLSFINWLLDPQEDQDWTALLYIAKKNGIVYLKLILKDNDEITHYDDPNIYKESAPKLIQLWEELYTIKQKASDEIAIMYEEGEYYLKPVSLYSFYFIKISNKQYKTDGVNKDDAERGALAKFLEALTNFQSIYQWLESAEIEIVIPVGKLIKNQSDIIIQYHKPERFLHLSSTLPLAVFTRLIQTYQRLINEGHEEFLLLEEPTYFAFMTDLFEEIKIYKE